MGTICPCMFNFITVSKMGPLAGVMPVDRTASLPNQSTLNTPQSSDVMQVSQKFFSRKMVVPPI